MKKLEYTSTLCVTVGFAGANHGRHASFFVCLNALVNTSLDKKGHTRSKIIDELRNLTAVFTRVFISVWPLTIFGTQSRVLRSAMPTRIMST